MLLILYTVLVCSELYNRQILTWSFRLWALIGLAFDSVTVGYLLPKFLVIAYQNPQDIMSISCIIVYFMILCTLWTLFNNSQDYFKPKMQFL